MTYHRILPDLDPATPIDDLVRAEAEAAAALVEQLRPAVLQPASNHVNAQVALALRDRYGIPVVYEVRGFLEETWRSRADTDVAESDRYRASRDVETACMRDADAVVTLSETMRTDILDRGGTDPDRVVVVPNGVDVDRFVPGPRDPALAARVGVGTDPVIGYISSFTGYEGIRYLIEATAELRRRGRRVRCLLVGDGEERAALEATRRRGRGRRRDRASSPGGSPTTRSSTTTGSSTCSSSRARTTASRSWSRRSSPTRRWRWSARWS